MYSKAHRIASRYPKLRALFGEGTALRPKPFINKSNFATKYYACTGTQLQSSHVATLDSACFAYPNHREGFDSCPGSVLSYVRWNLFCKFFETSDQLCLFRRIWCWLNEASEPSCQDQVIESVSKYRICWSSSIRRCSYKCVRA